MTIEERLGKETYAKRRREEDDRIAEFCQYVSPKFTYIKIHFIRPFEIFVMKLLGLYKKGYREFHDIQVAENEVPVANLPAELEGFTLMQMSDLHIDLDPTILSSIKTSLLGLRYDAAVLTGDYKNLTVGDWKDAVGLMTQLRQSITAPTYAVLGNHDTLDMVDPLEAAGYKVLLNESVILERAGKKILLAGVDDPYIYQTHDIPRALANAPAADAKILLAHAPTVYAEAANAAFDLMLCGHTHGGQVCLPNGAPICNHGRCPRRFVSGRWSYNNLVGYTSRGTGGCGVPIRFFCRPEITLHRLTRRK